MQAGSALALVAMLAGCGGSGGQSLGPVSKTPVSYAAVERVLATNCQSCHPLVNGALDLRPAHWYSQIVGVPAVEAPGQVRVVAGDPAASFLYQKVAGSPGLGRSPSVGSRMPPGGGLTTPEIKILRDWIAQGAKNASGQTVSAGAVPLRGSAQTFTGAPPAQTATGSGAVTGRVTDQTGKPIRGAIITMLLRGPSFPDGEEHVRAAVSGRDGHYTLPRIPVGRVELKAYAPGSIYVSRVVEVGSGTPTSADFGLPFRRVQNPLISAPRVTSAGGATKLALTLAGTSLDRNYTLAVNPTSGRALELRARTDANGVPVPGEWDRTVSGRFTGDWIFLATDVSCNVSEFLRVPSSA